MSEEGQPMQPEQPQDPMTPKWGDKLDTILAKHQQELRDLAEQQKARAAQLESERKLEQSAFKDVTLNGADVFFLAALALAEVVLAFKGDLEAAAAKLRSVQTDVARPTFDLSMLHLEGADLGWATLEGANLYRAHLEGANLAGAELTGANLAGAELAGANLAGAELTGANLAGATLDGKTTLAGAFILSPDDTRPFLARLLRRLRYGPGLGDLHWRDFDLMQLTQLEGWEGLRRLADERDLSWRNNADDHRRAVRAYRQVAQRLRDQGFSDVADRLSDRAQVLQRKLLFSQMLEDGLPFRSSPFLLRHWRPWRLPGDLVRWLFSWFLAILAGYGYHPGRSVFWYLATIAGFTFMFMQATQGWIPFGLPAPSQFAPLPWYEALILSVSSFHGRGFFQPLQSLGDPIAALAAIEAVIGLLIEISFIATFTQRFFGAR